MSLDSAVISDLKKGEPKKVFLKILLTFELGRY